MPESVRCVQMDTELSRSSPERNLWSEVIHLMLWDYAHFRREYLTKGGLSVTRMNKYRRLRYSVFGAWGSLTYIASLLEIEPDGLIEASRRAVSDAKIKTGFVLGRKMREDDPNIKASSLAERERREGE